jgi:hypothetical protein
MLLNKINKRKRIASGKRAVIHDISMEDNYVADEEGPSEHSFELTDGKNDEFVYIY